MVRFLRDNAKLHRTSRSYFALGKNEYENERGRGIVLSEGNDTLYIEGTRS